MSTKKALSDSKAVFKKKDQTTLAEYQGNLKQPIPANCKLKIEGKPVVLESDYLKVVKAAPYKHKVMADVPGFGSLKIIALNGQHKAKKLTVSGQPVLRLGPKFDSLYLHAPAQKIPAPAPPIPDVPPHSGKGEFETSQNKLKTA